MLARIMLRRTRDCIHGFREQALNMHEVKEPLAVDELVTHPNRNGAIFVVGRAVSWIAQHGTAWSFVERGNESFGIQGSVDTSSFNNQSGRHSSDVHGVAFEPWRLDRPEYDCFLNLSESILGGS